MRIHLTGRVTIEGRRTIDQSDLPGRQGRLALTYLVLERHRPVPTAELVAAIWGDEPPRSVDTSVRALISKLRSVLDDAAPDAGIVADAGCYQPRLVGAWVDVEVARAELDRAEGAARTEDLEGALAPATVAAGIAIRPLLPAEDVDWVAEARGRLRSVRVRALAILTAAYRARGDVPLAIAIAHDLIELEPFREASHRALMEAHLRGGDRAEALRSYERCRALLAEELGVAPDPETEALHVRALRAG